MTIFRRKLLRDMRRHRPQFLALAMTVFLGVTLFGGSRDAYRSLVASYDSLFDRLAFADRWLIGGDADVAAARAAELDGVAATATRHQADVPLRVGDVGLNGRLVGIPVGGQPAVNGLFLHEGRLPEQPGEVVADHHLADEFDLRPGDTVVVAGAGPRAEATITGVATSVEYLWLARDRQDVLPSPRDFGVLYAVQSDVQRWGGAAAVRHGLVRYESGLGTDEALRIDEEVVRIGRAAGMVDTYDRAAQPSNEALQQDVKGFGDFAFMFPVLFLTAAGLGSSMLLTRMVQAERATIGMLRANGASSRAVFGHYVSYGVAAALLGAVPGAVAGVLLAWLFAGFYTDLVGVPITVLEVGGLTPFLGVTFAVVAGALFGLLPARRAARISPSEAMRGIAPITGGGRTLIERLVPVARKLPPAPTYVLRAAYRNPRRTITTSLGIVLSLILVLVSAGMLDTVDYMLDRQFQVVQQEDAHVLYDRARPEVFDELAAVEGVARVERSLLMPVVLEAGDERYATTLTAFEPDTAMHRFETSPGRRVELPIDGLLVGADVESILDVRAGDTVTLRVPHAGVVADVPVVALLDEPVGTLAYAALPAAERLLGDSVRGGPASALVRYVEGADRDALEARLEAVPGVAAVIDRHGLLEQFRDFFGLFYGFVGAMLLFGAMLAFALIFNAMSVNFSERTVELATLRAAGVPTRRIGRLVTAENLIVTVLAVIPGLVIGLFAARQFLAAYDTDQFTLDLHVRWWTPTLAAGGMLLVALLSQRPGLRAVSRLDVAGVVRERAL